jgi:hypothetical protein
MTLRGQFFAVTAGLALLAGCSAGPSGGGGDAAAAPPALQEVNDLLHAAGAARPPTNLADLNRYKGKFLRGYEAVKSGEIVVLWGTPVQGEGEVGQNEQVMAYEKDVPTSGGYVLMSAGTIKKMSASEFNAAPKAGKR